MSAPTRELKIELVGDDAKWSRATKNAIKNSDTLGSRLKKAGAVGAAALGGAAVAGAAALTYGVIKATQAAEEKNKVYEQTKAVLKSTGAEAWITAGQIEGLSGAISKKGGLDDEAVQSAANLLATFKEVRNEAGEGNDMFDRTLGIVADLSVAMGKDLNSAAIMVGKAMNNPISGATALGRAGVQLTEQQKEQIEKLQESGQMMAAQKIVLRELESQFGGSAAAQATAMDRIEVSIGNVQESVGNVFLPLIEEGAETLDKHFIPELQKTADALADIAGRKDLDLEEKLGLAGDVIKRQWGGVPGEIGKVLDAAVPVVAEHAGQLGVTWARGMFTGFLHADPLGKAALLLFASKAFGGPAALLGAGRTAGSKFGGGMATESSLAMASMFGMGSGGAKTFGLIEKAKRAGGVIGKLGLGLGLMEGAAAVFESPAEGLMDRLEQVDSRGSGLLGSIERVTGLSAAASAVGIENWAEQGDAAHRLAEILGEINDTHGEQHRLLAAEARELENQLDLTREQRKEAEATLRVQALAGQGFQEGVGGLRGGKFTTLPDITSVVRRNDQALSESKLEEGSQGYRNAVAKNYEAAARAVEIGMDRSVIKTKKGWAEIRRYTREAKLVSGDDPWGIAKGFGRSWEKAGGVTKDGLTSIQRDLGKMSPQAARMTGEMMVAMAQQMRRKGQLSKAEVEKIRSAVVTKLSLMATQGGKKGAAFAANLGGAFGGLSVTTAEALENIGVNVEGVLKSLGYNKFERYILRFYAAKGAGRQAGAAQGFVNEMPELEQARGGLTRVPGQGRRDTVPLAVNGSMAAIVAPGEDLIVANRHQRPELDYAVQRTYGDAGLDGFFQRNNRPHYMAGGGLLAPKPKLTGPQPTVNVGRGAIDDVYGAATKYVRKHSIPRRVMHMLSFAEQEARKGYPYVYGGGHGALGAGPYDCSGYVSAILGAGNFIGAPMSVQQGSGLYTLGEAGAGKWLTWGVRGSSGMNAHTMAAIKDARQQWNYFESGSGHGAAEVGGWSGGFSFRHIPGFARGGRPKLWGSGKGKFRTGGNYGATTVRGRRRATGGFVAPPPVAAALAKYGDEALDPKSKHFVGWGLARGGLARFSQGGIVTRISDILMRNGLDKEAAAGIIGNAYGESNLDPGSIEPGTHNGGLWGFTASPVSLAEMKAYAESQGLPWTSVKAQTQFLLHNLGIHDPNFKDRLNAADSVAETTRLFMDEWENPESMASLGKRTAFGEKAIGMIGAGGVDSGGGPPTKGQKTTLGGLRHRAGALLREIRKLQAEYKKMGGTGRGKRSLERALKFARMAARKEKAGSRDEAKDLIDRARDALGDSRGALEQAASGVFTAGLRPGALPPLGAGGFDPSQEFSITNLPGLEALPPSVQSQLISPGLSATGKYGVLETALSEAGATDTKADDGAALNAMLGMSRQRRKRLKGQLDELNKRLKKPGITKKQRETLVTQRDSVLSALGEVSGNIGSIREQIGGLNEESETDNALQEAIEANTQAIEDQASAQRELAKQIKAQVDFANAAAATGSASAWASLADHLAGRMGGAAQLAANTAGNGSIGTLNGF